jgi:protein TonB
MSQQRRSPFVLASVAVHAAFLAGAILTSILAPDLLPMPREVLAFRGTDRVIQLKDVDLPAPKRSPATRAATASAIVAAPRPDAAPIDAPDRVTPETGRESDGTDLRSGAAAVEQSAGGVDGTGLAEVAPPPPPPPPTPIRLHSGIVAPMKTVDAAPRYPDIARASRVEGMVILEVIIDDRGNVTTARVLRSVPLLDEAALDAVRRWKFTPARLNGESVPVVMTVTVNFKLQP